MIEIYKSDITDLLKPIGEPVRQIALGSNESGSP